MADLIGGTPDFPGKNNHIVGTNEADVIFGDPYTTGNFFGLPALGALSSGKGGNDHVDGGIGDDYIVGDAVDISGNARGGNDHLAGGDGSDFVFGDADVFLSDDARGGNDLLEGGEGDDYLVGEGLVQFDDTRGGNDRLYGGEGADRLFGDVDGNMFSRAGGGNDWLEGGAGDDVLTGDAGGMFQRTRGGNDVLIGGEGNDQLYGDADPIFSDLTNVTRGTDRFVFANGSGLDTIFDFEDDKDVIDLTGYAGIADFAQVGAQTTQVLADVRIDLGAAAGGAADVDVVTLVAFVVDDLDAGDFDFA